MGMGYYIGYNKSQPVGQQVTYFSCNSYAHSLLLYLIDKALGGDGSELYDKITLNVGSHFMQFDKLNQQEFMSAVIAIRNVIKNGDDSIAENAHIWNFEIEPLILIDDRYDPNFKLVDF